MTWRVTRCELAGERGSKDDCQVLSGGIWWTNRLAYEDREKQKGGFLWG